MLSCHSDIMTRSVSFLYVLFISYCQWIQLDLYFSSSNIYSGVLLGVSDLAWIWQADPASICGSGWAWLLIIAWARSTPANTGKYLLVVLTEMPEHKKLREQTKNKLGLLIHRLRTVNCNLGSYSCGQKNHIAEAKAKESGKTFAL